VEPSTQLVRIGDCFDVAIGGTPARKNKDFWDLAKKSENVWVSIRDISSVKSGRVEDSKEHITDLGIKKSNVKLIPKGTTLMTFKLTIGKTVVTGRDLYTNEAIAAFLPKKGIRSDPYYLAAILPTLQYDVDRAVKGKTLNKTKLENALLPLPPIEIQERIAMILRTLESTILPTDKSISETGRLKRALMQRFFDPNINTWPVKKLSQVSIVQTGIAKNSAVSGSDTVEMPYLRVANVQDGHLDLSEIKNIRIKARDVKRFSLQKGDLLLTEGGDYDKLGRGYLWDGTIEQCLHQNHVFAVRADRRVLNEQYLAYLTQSQYGKNYFLSVAIRTTNLASINSTKLKDFPVLLPSIEKQLEIVSVLRAVDEKLIIDKKLKITQEKLKHGLMKDLLTGKVSV
jgi:type I restriction enzyme S subunit